jgi:hypothetical protein
MSACNVLNVAHTGTTGDASRHPNKSRAHNWIDDVSEFVRKHDANYGNYSSCLMCYEHSI